MIRAPSLRVPPSTQPLSTRRAFSTQCGRRARLVGNSLVSATEHQNLHELLEVHSILFPGIAGLHPSSFHRRMRKLRRSLEPLRREIVSELVGDPETLLIVMTQPPLAIFGAL